MLIEVMKLKGKNGGWWWHVKAANGEIIAHSEGYTTKAKAIKTAKLIINTKEWTIKVK